MTPAEAGCGAYEALAQAWLRLAAACEGDADPGQIDALQAEAQALLDALVRLDATACSAEEAERLAVAARLADGARTRAAAAAEDRRERLHQQLAALPGRDAAVRAYAPPPVPMPARFLDERR